MANTPEIDLKLPSTADNIAEQINIDTVDNLTKIDNAIKNDRQQINSLGADKANKSWGDWLTLTLQSDWTGTIRYRKNEDLGLVQLRGAAQVGTITSGTVIAVMPSKYYDSVQTPLLTHLTTNGKAITGIMISTNGNITIQKPAINDLVTGSYLAINQVFKVGA